MRTVTDWFGEYGESHAHPTNKLIHWICVPLIVMAVIGFLWLIPVPDAFAAVSPWLNWATLVAAIAVIYYFTLSPVLAFGVALSYVVMFAVLTALASLPWPLWATLLVIFVLAWIGQFIGHAVEGKRPSFYKDLQFLMIGPLWLIAALFRGLGLRY